MKQRPNKTLQMIFSKLSPTESNDYRVKVGREKADSLASGVWVTDRVSARNPGLDAAGMGKRGGKGWCWVGVSGSGLHRLPRDRLRRQGWSLGQLVGGVLLRWAESRCRSHSFPPDVR